MFCSCTQIHSIKLYYTNVILKLFFSHKIRLSGRELSQTELVAIPPYIRFDSVALVYYPVIERINQKCEWIQMILQPIKRAIAGAKFEFGGIIAMHLDDFSDHTMLLTHLQKELLPICDACRSYKFKIFFYSDQHSATDVIATILQFGPIDVCQNVFFDLSILLSEIPLPVDAIVNWLNRSGNFKAINVNEQIEKERILEIQIDYYIPNILAMLNGLKKVN